MQHQYALEHRQHLNLSLHACDVIELDSYAFMDKPSLSGFINRIIINYQDISEANIGLSVERKKQAYMELLADSSLHEPGEDVRMAVDIFCEGYRQKLIEKFADLPKERSFKMRLSNENYESFYGRGARERDTVKYYAVPGQYIKALLEDYAALPFADREAVYFRETIRTISSVVDSQEKRKPLLKVQLKRVQDRAPQTFLVKPYRIMRDPEDSYNYLVGLSRSYDEPGKMSPACFRVSRMDKVRVLALSHGSGKITYKEMALLTEALKKPVRFFMSYQEVIRVLLTPAGEQRFKQVLHLRPTVTEVREHSGGLKEYIFKCSEFQAGIYFYGFGKDAVVCSPESIHEEFEGSYKEAYETYKNHPA